MAEIISRIYWIGEDNDWFLNAAISTNNAVCAWTNGGVGHDAYNEWSTVTSGYEAYGSSYNLGTIASLGENHRTDKVGLYLKNDTMLQSISTGNRHNELSDHEFYDTTIPDYNVWSYSTDSNLDILNNYPVTSVNYTFHFQCWCWRAGVMWPFASDSYVYIHIEPQAYTTSSFPLSYNNNEAEVKVSGLNSMGLYKGNGTVVNGTGSEIYVSKDNDNQTLYTIPQYENSSTDESGSTFNGVTYEISYHTSIRPATFKFSWKTYQPTITRNGRTLNISCSPWPSNGFSLYRDGNIVSNSHNSSTYEIPIEYMVGSHTWSVVANRESYVTNINRSVCKAWPDSNSNHYFPFNQIITGDVYYTSDSASTSYSMNLDSPVITNSSKTYLNRWRLDWNTVSNATSYSVKLDNGEWTNISTNINYEFTNLSLGDHIFYIRANYSDSNYNSEASSANGTTTRLPQTYNLVFNRTSVNSGLLSWGTQYADTNDTVYGVYDGVLQVNITNNTTYTLTNLAQGSHIFKIIQKFTPDETYNSLPTEISYDMTKLRSPLSISLADIRGNVYQVPNDTTSSIVTSNGKIGIRLTYPTLDTYQGITYKIYNNVFSAYDEEIIDENPDSESTSTKTMYWNTRTPAYGTVGKHRIYPQAVFEADHNYDSDLVFTKDASVGNPATAYVDYEINTLSAPTLVWNGNNETSRIYESYLTWLPSTATSETGEYPDYYITYVIANGDVNRTVLGNVYTVLQPEDKDSRLGVFIPDPNPITNGVSGLIPQMPSATGTTTYAVCVASCSYSPWYVGNSTASESTYQIIKLGIPDNILWDPDHFTLSWSPVLNATHYYLYDNGSDITPYPETDVPRGITDTSYTFDSLGAGLHRFQVTALKITTEEV